MCGRMIIVIPLPNLIALHREFCARNPRGGRKSPPDYSEPASAMSRV